MSVNRRLTIFLQCSVATYLRFDGVLSSHIFKKKFITESVSKKNKIDEYLAKLQTTFLLVTVPNIPRF